MSEMKYVYGPIPSRRLGRSLGVSPIPKKACNYSCVYCQLGRTDMMTNTRQEYFKLEDILAEFDRHYGQKGDEFFDVITIVGEGEPTLYSRVGDLIKELKKRTKKPVAIITNSALFYDETLRDELMEADIVLPSLDAYDDESFKKIDRPHGSLDFDKVFRGLVRFSKEYKGQLWMELMLIRDMNDDDKSLEKFQNLLKKIDYDRVYINTPVRPPAEGYVQVCTRERLEKASKMLGANSIEVLTEGSFYSDEKDDYEAIFNILPRHPLNQFELAGFLASRGCEDARRITERLNHDRRVEQTFYKGYITYRLK